MSLGGVTAAGNWHVTFIGCVEAPDLPSSGDFDRARLNHKAAQLKSTVMPIWATTPYRWFSQLRRATPAPRFLLGKFSRTHGSS